VVVVVDEVDEVLELVYGHSGGAASDGSGSGNGPGKNPGGKKKRPQKCGAGVPGMIGG
jgi:hypothetical protein